MNSISKANHEKICKRLIEMLYDCGGNDNNLVELKSELESLFRDYQNQLNNLKVLIMQYDAKQKNARSVMRKIYRSTVLTINNIDP